MPKTLKALRNQRMLTISEVEGFIQEGGMASLVVKRTGVVANKVIPDINPTACENWKFEPQLLATIKRIQDQYQ